MAREDLLTQTFVELADNLVADFDVVEFLTSLASRCVQLLPIASAGILLADHHGKLQFAAASNEDAELLELFSLQHDEGPCLDCFRTGEPVANHDLMTAGATWLQFAPAAVRAGYRTVHAMPMRLRDTVVGSLNLFSAESHPLPRSDLLIAQALADVATISIVQDRTLRDAHLLAEQLGHALNSRVAIEQAKGVLAERCRIDMNDAFTRLRRYSRAHSRRLSSVAFAVIDGSLTERDLTRAVEDA